MLKINPNKQHHFLLVHCKEYSDGISVILALQCIESLSKNFPNSTISFLIHSSMKDFFKCNPFLQHLFFIDTPNIVRELKHANIDISISLSSDKKSTLAIFSAGIKTRIGVFSHIHSLLFNYKVKQKRLHSNKHEAQFNLDLLKPLGCNQILYPKIYLNISEKQESQQYLENLFGADSFLQSGFIAIYAGNGLGYGWAAKNFFFLANELATQHNVLIVGTPQELESYKVITPNYQNLSAKNFLNIVEFFGIHNTEDLTQIPYNSLRYMLNIISHAKLFIANNNTLLHAAAALDVPTLSFFPHRNALSPIRYAPCNVKKKHIIFTPFGIFDMKNPPPIQQDNDVQGLRMEDILPSLILEILKQKILIDE